MVEETHDSAPEGGGRQPEYLTVTSGLPPIRAVGMDAPWRWLRAGWRDFRAATGTPIRSTAFANRPLAEADP